MHLCRLTLCFLMCVCLYQVNKLLLTNILWTCCDSPHQGLMISLMDKGHSALFCVSMEDMARHGILYETNHISKICGLELQASARRCERSWIRFNALCDPHRQKFDKVDHVENDEFVPSNTTFMGTFWRCWIWPLEPSEEIPHGG